MFSDKLSRLFGNSNFQLTLLHWSLGGRNVELPEQTQEHAAVACRSQRWVPRQTCRPTRGEQGDCNRHSKSVKTTPQVSHLHYTISEIQQHEPEAKRCERDEATVPNNVFSTRERLPQTNDLNIWVDLSFVCVRPINYKSCTANWYFRLLIFTQITQLHFSIYLCILLCRLN